MFNKIKEVIPNHEVIRMKIIYHTYDELDEENDNVLTCCIFPIEVDDTGDVSDTATMTSISDYITEHHSADPAMIYPTTGNLYFNVKWSKVTELWKIIRKHLNTIATEQGRITINYNVSSMEYEIIIPGNDEFPYTSVMLLELRDICLLKLLSYNDLSVVTEYLKKVQFSGDDGDLSITVSFVRMDTDEETTVDTDSVIDKVKEVLSSTPDILADEIEGILSTLPDKEA